MDAEGKTSAYAKLLGPMRGDVEATFYKSGSGVRRCLEGDRHWLDARSGANLMVPGRSLLFVRNVGHLMTTPAVLLPDGTEALEGILDALVTPLIGMHDLKHLGGHVNSRAGSIYVVKPEMHGPIEAAYANALFEAVEAALGLPPQTVELGPDLDKGRRTECGRSPLSAAVERSGCETRI